MERTSCARGFEAPLEEWLLEQSPELTEFRAHCRTCLACAQQLLAQERVIGTLTRQGEHPASELLLAFARRADTLTASVRKKLEGHVQRCGDCRMTLEAFAELTPASVRAAATSAAPSGLRAWIAGQLSALDVRWLSAAAAGGLAAALALGGPSLFQGNAGDPGSPSVSGSPQLQTPGGGKALSAGEEPFVLTRIALEAGRSVEIDPELAANAATPILLDIPWPAGQRERLLAHLVREGSDDAIDASFEPPIPGLDQVELVVPPGWMREAGRYRLELRTADAAARVIERFALEVPPR